MTLTTSAESILERARRDVEDGLVPAEIFNDRGIYERELGRIFTRCWVFVGHESELPDPGDYRLRRIGEDSFIFLRGDDGVIRVLLNSCRHRGSTICRLEVGNTATFRCPYHAWTYDNRGELVGVPSRTTAYRQLDLAEWGLVPAPKVDRYHGLVFACLDPDGPALEAYLGRFRWYLDMQLAATEGGMEVLGEPHRWRVPADWKSGAENFTGDSSHTQMTHRSILTLGLADEATAGRVGGANGVHVNDLDGHAISLRLLAGTGEAFLGYPRELWPAIENGPLAPGQIDLLRRGLVHDGTVFPNFSFIHFGGVIDSGRPASGFLSMRVWQPLGPGEMEVWSWMLAPREASAEYKELAYRAGMTTFSPSGHFEQDDTIVWSGIARSARSTFVRKQGIRFNYQMGMAGMADTAPMPDWPGPGRAWPSNAGESGLRAFHHRWLEQMVGP